MTLFAVKRCSSVSVRPGCSRSERWLLYLAEVCGHIRQSKHCQALIDEHADSRPRFARDHPGVTGDIHGQSAFHNMRHSGDNTPWDSNP